MSLSATVTSSAVRVGFRIRHIPWALPIPGELEKHARRTRIALVGHEPSIGEIAARLVGSRHPIEFKKGAVCRIDVEQLPPHGPADLRWFMPPRALRYIQK